MRKQFLLGKTTVHFQKPCKLILYSHMKQLLMLQIYNKSELMYVSLVEPHFKMNLHNLLIKKPSWALLAHNAMCSYLQDRYSFLHSDSLVKIHLMVWVRTGSKCHATPDVNSYRLPGCLSSGGRKRRRRLRLRCCCLASPSSTKDLWKPDLKYVFGGSICDWLLINTCGIGCNRSD